MRPSNTARESQTWLIDDIAPDFRLLDVWPLPVEGDREDFASFVEMMASVDPTKGSVISRALFWIRFRVGSWFGWDESDKTRRIPGSAETTLSMRLPDALRARMEKSGLRGSQPGSRFRALYSIEDEYAAEISNDTVHGVLHFAWMDQGRGRYRAQMSVYVKPHGALGEIYLLLIQPFRHVVVYPAFLRQIGRAWDARSAVTLRA
jgi:hypothetical protein